jgi:hypothetical protein
MRPVPRLAGTSPDLFTIGVMGIVLAIASFGLALVLFDAWHPERSAPSPFAQVTTQNGLRLTISRLQKTDHGPERAFNDSTDPDSFWESTGPFPIELTVEFPRPTILSNYTFRAHPESTRMPSQWLVEGAEDGREWVVLDEEQMREGWEANQSRTFPLRSRMSVRQIRFRFLQAADATILRIHKIELR